MSIVDVQLYGPLKELAGEAKIRVGGENVGEILEALMLKFGSGFKDELFDGGKIKGRYLLLLNGRRVGRDETYHTLVSEGDKCMIFAPIAGG